VQSPSTILVIPAQSRPDLIWDRDPFLRSIQLKTLDPGYRLANASAGNANAEGGASAVDGASIPC
jgi:hypothetical protein